MATNRWIGLSGDWSNPSDWSAGAVPGPSDEAVIAAAGSYTVTVTASESVGSIVLNDPGAILDIQPSPPFQTVALDVSGSVVIQSGTLEIQGEGYHLGGGTLAIGGSLDVQSGATLFLDGGTIEGGSLIIARGGAFEANESFGSVGPVGTSTLQNVTVLGGLTLNSGALLLAGNTIVENSDGTGPGAITLNGSNLFFAENYTLYSLTLNGGLVGGLGSTLTVTKGGLVQGYGEFIYGGLPYLALDNDGTINSNVNGQSLTFYQMPFVNDGLVLASGGGNISINANDPYYDPWSNNADGIISVIDGGTLDLGGRVTNSGLITAVNSTLYFGADVVALGGVGPLAQNAGDIVVLGGKLFLDSPGSFQEWTDSGLIFTVGAAVDVLGTGEIAADGTMSILGGSLSGQAPLEDDGQIKLRDASVDLASLTIGASGELSGSGTVANAIENLGIIDARRGIMDLGGAITGSGQFQISKAATLELGGATAEAVTFESNHGTLHLDTAHDFSGTIAGMAKADSVDLADFAFSSHPVITSVSGTGAAGTTTDVTITDGSLTTTLQLLNQYAGQYPVAPKAYNLTSDHPGSASAGTLFTLASPHGHDHDQFVFAPNLGENGGKATNANVQHNEPIEFLHQGGELADLAALMVQAHAEGAHLMSAPDAIDMHHAAALAAHHSLV